MDRRGLSGQSRVRAAGRAQPADDHGQDASRQGHRGQAEGVQAADAQGHDRRAQGRAGIAELRHRTVGSRLVVRSRGQRRDGGKDRPLDQAGRDQQHDDRTRRDELLDEVWGRDVYVVDRTVDVHVRKIREKIGSDYIETVKGVGYKLNESMG